MTTTWPGSPQTWWDDVADVPSDRWVPGPEDLPTCRTPEEVGRSYAVVAPLVSRAAMPILAAFVLGAAVPVALTSRIWFDWASVGAVRQTAGVLLVVLLALATAYAVAAFVVGEVRLRRARPETLRRVARQLEGERRPVWGVLARRVRVSRGTSGSDTGPDDLLVVLDLRVARPVLQRQLATVEAWLDAVSAQPAAPTALAAAFSGRDAVHAVEAFGEPLRGVWLWRKRAVLPRETLGLALVDPREAAAFTRDDAVFLRRTPREVLRRSRLDRD